MPAYTCHETEITNVSNGTLSRVSMFGGRELAPGQSFLVAGDVDAWLAGKFPGIKGVRMIRKLRDLVDAGILAITHKPSSPCGNTRWQSSSSMFIPP